MGGGEPGKHRVKNLLGNFGTTIFLSNADPEICEYASKMIGEGPFEETQRTVAAGEKPTESLNTSIKYDRMVRPNEFSRLLTGGPRCNNKVEGFIYKQGPLLFGSYNHKKLVFNQQAKP